MKKREILKKVAAVAVAMTTIIAATLAPAGKCAKVYAADVTVNVSHHVTATNEVVTMYIDPGVVGQSYELIIKLYNDTGTATNLTGAYRSATGSDLGDTDYTCHDDNRVINNGEFGTVTWSTDTVFKEIYYGKPFGSINLSFGGGVESKLIVRFKNKSTAEAEKAAAAAAAGDEWKPCMHEYEWVTSTHATEDENGIEEYKCKFCGDVQRVDWVSAYLIFNQNTANKIKKAPANGTVKIETSRWVSYHKMVFDELAKRPDVTLVTDYTYDHVKYEMTIPAGAYAKPANAAATLDENGYAGYRRISTIYPTTLR